MNLRAIILLVVAIVIAAVTVILIKNRDQPAVASGTKVLIATSDIVAGNFVHADKDLAWADWPTASIAPSFITSDAHKIEEYNGGVARRAILAGEPITAVSIVRANEGGFMSAVLAQGKRAVSIAVSPTSGNAGFIFPGDKVDLILTHRIPVKDGGSDVLASESFVENVRVLAIDQMLDNPDNKAVVAKTITLEVTPRQAEMVNVATSLGSISVSLRSLANDTTKNAAATSSAVTPVSGAIAPTGTSAAIATPVAAAGNTYTTDNDVSKLMGNKSAVHDKVSIFHGSTTEQIDFHGGQK